MRKLLAILAILAILAPVPAAPQAGSAATQTSVPLVERRAYGTNTYSACVTTGEGGTASGRWNYVEDKVVTTGSSTTVDALSAATTAPFQNVSAGDSLRFVGIFHPTLPPNPFRIVATRASADQITVNTAIDLDDATAFNDPGGYSFFWRKLVCGTAVGSGWFPVKEYRSGNFLLIAHSESSATSGIDYKLGCYVDGASGGGAEEIVVTTGNVPQATIAAGATSVALGAFDYGTYGWAKCRVMVKVAAGSVTYSVYADMRE